jgi:hypothetical protein
MEAVQNRDPEQLICRRYKGRSELAESCGRCRSQQAKVLAPASQFPLALISHRCAVTHRIENRLGTHSFSV